MKDVKSLAASTNTSSISRSISEIAADVDAYSIVDVPAGIIDGWNEGLASSVFNHANLTVVKGVSILSNTNLTAAKANSITASANLTSDREQLYLRQIAANLAINRLMDIITVNASNVTISTDTTITNKNIYRSLIVNSAVTLTVNTTSELVSSVLLAYSITNNGTIARTPQGGFSGYVDSNPGGAGAIYRISTNATGLGGSGGTDEYGAGGGGRDGAGSLGLGVGGAGGANTYTTKTAAELTTLFLNAVIDYLIRTVQSKTAPTSVQEFIDIYGAGGGCQYLANPGGKGGGGMLIIAKTLDNNSTISATGQGSPSVSGSGGGSGGEIIIVVDNYDNTGGTISSIGGAAYTGRGGGGGGGGIIYILYKTQTGAGTLTVTGGVGGLGGLTNGAAGIASAIAI